MAALSTFPDVGIVLFSFDLGNYHWFTAVFLFSEMPSLELGETFMTAKPYLESRTTTSPVQLMIATFDTSN
jgi:hypothetical protein